MEKSNVKEMNLLGQKIQVKETLTYKEIIQWAQEYVARAAVLHPAGVAYWGHLRDAVLNLTVLKALTDMDISVYETEDGLMKLADDIAEDEAYQEFLLITRNIRMDIAEMAERMYENLKLVYEKENSLENKIKESFGFLLNGEDLTETLAHGRETNEQMIEHLGAIMKVKELMNGQAKPIDLSQYAKKKK